MDTSAGRPGAATAVRDPLVGRTVDGRYQIVAKLARGGMATVYEALDLRLDRVVAIKVMHPGLADDQAFVDRFQREAKAAARLSHPHVVSVFDQGADGGLVYLVMEYVPGRTVRDVLREHGRLSPEQALTILDPVLQALAAAHRAGFVHRDIKPENVLLGDDGAVKVADFGLARAISTSTSTATQGVLIGTVAYLSPEQVERGVADGRSDVYSCGILLYEMLTGAVPYAGETPLAVAYQHVNAAVPRPSSIRSDVPAAVDDLVGRATRHDPDERFATADDFLEPLRRARRDLPPPRPLQVDTADGASTLVVALPTGEQPAGAGTGGPGRPTGRRRRRRGPVVLLAILLLAALVGAVSWWFGSARVVPVPSAVGKTLEQAQPQFATAGLTLEAGEPAFSETVPAGRVITTDPVPGGDARVGSTVTATVSKGKERYPVPDVKGQTADAATQMLLDGGLTLGTTRQGFSADVAVGLVAGSNPPAGRALKRGQAVDLVVSKGPQPVVLPKLVGTSLTRGKRTLDRLGLKATTTTAYDDKQPVGDIVATSPGAGTTLKPGDSVALVISKGPPPVLVPNLFGRGADSATQTLRDLGLKTRVEYPKGHAFNLVYSQSVNGTTVPRGSTVTLFVF